jgi:ribosomal protein L30E
MTNIEKQILQYEIATGYTIFGTKLTKQQIRSNKIKLKQGEDLDYEMQL